MTRVKCVICTSTLLTPIYSFRNFPIKADCVEISVQHETDLCTDMTLVACQTCNCIQVETPVDPAQLYSDTYTTATYSLGWQDHHRLFAEFIQRDSPSKLLEIGGNCKGLYAYLTNIDYTVLDMFKDEHHLPSIPFIQGNCETFDYTSFDTIVLSHVFEHLHTPRTFLKQIRAANVTTVYLSIPDFEDQYRNRLRYVINNQHTFFCSLQHILYLFGQYGYACERVSGCGGIKSHFIKCIRSTDSTVRPLVRNSEVWDLYDESMTTCSEDDVYICPAGQPGQLLWHSMTIRGIRVKGFLDNDMRRHGKRLYGTDLVVHHPSTIQSPIRVLIAHSLYTDEITETLRKNSNISCIRV